MSDSSIQALQSQFQSDLGTASTLKELDDLRIRYLGKKGLVTDLLSRIAGLQGEEKKSFGKEVNDLKSGLTRSLDEKKSSLEEVEREQSNARDKVDVTLPGRFKKLGTRHPLTLIREEITAIFNQMGFITVDGPEIEEDYYNFEALNIPKDHPARDSQDSFYLGAEKLLRTQTSPVQIRAMQKVKPPLAIVSPGRVFRRDELDATHSFIFQQIEGLLVAKDVTFAHLKGILHQFARDYFGADVKVRFRPDFFPFTEPSCELSIAFPGKKTSDGRTRWLEILGAGLVNPLVLKNVGIDPDVYSGLAFGMGIERIAMLRYGIQDIRHFYQNDIRFLNQFI